MGSEMCIRDRVEYESSDRNSITLLVNGRSIQVLDKTDESVDLNHHALLKHRNSWGFQIDNEGISIQKDATFVFIPFYSSVGAATGASSDAITAPMPGKIIALNVAVGDAVTEGDALVVMEAMKMEQTLTAPRDGIIAEIGADVGELVTDGAILVQLEEEE